MLAIQPLQTEQEIECTARLASEIWIEYFPDIIGQAQVDYMLDKFQSVRAITQQVNKGYEYYLIKYKGDNVGYFALLPNCTLQEMQISKLYLRKSARGLGFGAEIVCEIKQIAQQRKITTLWLTVNKNNTNAIKAYLRFGFHKVGNLVTDIGNNFVMDDYKMQCQLRD